MTSTEQISVLEEPHIPSQYNLRISGVQLHLFGRIVVAFAEDEGHVVVWRDRHDRVVRPAACAAHLRTRLSAVLSAVLIAAVVAATFLIAALSTGVRDEHGLPATNCRRSTTAPPRAVTVCVLHSHTPSLCSIREGGFLRGGFAPERTTP